MDRQTLATLSDLADRALKGDLARLAALRAARAALDAEARRLRAATEAEVRSGGDVAALAAYAGWRDWVADRRRRIEAETLALDAKMEAVRRRAIARLGRREAVGILERRVAETELQDERRGAERDGRPPDW